jgi:plasmid stabilization system protein ParE
MLEVAGHPEGPVARDRTDLVGDPEVKVRRPVHILYYRMVRPGLVEIVRVLHERMEPSRYIGGGRS